MKLSKFIFSVLIFGCCFCASPSFSQVANGSNLQSIESLDLQRYLGQWYEVAKFPNWFQKKCKTDTKAYYALSPNGRVQVLNSCRMEGGKVTEAMGEAVLVGEAKSAKLKVRFAPEWLSFLPWVWGDYWVVDLDDAYQLAAISEPRREYLWILSRSPEPGDKALNELMLRLIAKGFDLSPLERTQHKQDIPVK